MQKPPEILPSITAILNDAENGNLYTVNDVRSILRRNTIRAGSYEHLSREYDIAGSYISNVVNGVQDPGPAIIRALGFEKVVLYRKI